MHLVRPVVCSLTVLALVACSGGGSNEAPMVPDGAAEYTGPTRYADIFPDTVHEVADVIAKGYGGGVSYTYSLRDTVSNNRKIAQKLGVRAATEVIDDVIQCDSGTGTVKGTFNSTTGTGYYTISYQTCVQGGTTYDGSLTFEALEAYDVAIDNWTSTRLSFYDYSQRGDTQVLLNGNVRTDYSDRDHWTLVGNFTEENLVTRVQMRYENLREDISYVPSTTPGLPNIEYAIRGRVYHSARGYYVLTTLEKPVFFSSQQSYLLKGGRFKISGEGSSAEVMLAIPQRDPFADDALLEAPGVLPPDDQNYRQRRIIETDGQAFGMYVGQSTTYWPRPATQGPTAPSAGREALGLVVPLGQKVRVRCYDCYDHDGDIMSMDWSMVLTPDGPAAQGVPYTPSFDFRPAKPGLYQFLAGASDDDGNTTLTSVYVLAYELRQVGSPTSDSNNVWQPGAYLPELNKIVMSDLTSGHVLNLTSGATEFSFNAFSNASSYQPVVGLDGKSVLYVSADADNGGLWALNAQQLTLSRHEFANTQVMELPDASGAYLPVQGPVGGSYQARPRAKRYHRANDQFPAELVPHAVYAEVGATYAYAYSKTFPAELSFAADGKHGIGYDRMRQNVIVYALDDSEQTDGIEVGAAAFKNFYPFDGTRTVNAALDSFVGGFWFDTCTARRDPIDQSISCVKDAFALYAYNGNRLARFIVSVPEGMTRTGERRPWKISSTGQRSLFFSRVLREGDVDKTELWQLRF